MRKFLTTFKFLLALSLILLLLNTSTWQPSSQEEKIRPFTRTYEFDFVSWTLDALFDKLSMAGFGFNHYLDFTQDRKIMRDYFQLLKEQEQLESSLEAVFVDPENDDPEQDAFDLQRELSVIQSDLKKQASLAEVVVQKQISMTLVDIGLADLGQPFPPILYHATNLPKELIISPRDVIEQSASISLEADMDLESIIELEDTLEANSDYSALVVSIGGISTYPTMVINTTSLPYLLDTVAHEWMHNYLVFRPLGMHYSSSPELRTMNETTATIASEEISDAVIKKYYYDLLEVQQPSYKEYEVAYHPSQNEDSEEFNFDQEMYQTRIKVDELLAQGQIQEAEDYMEERRQVFWDNGYQIRKLNQAYFAFHGAYADQPYSAAGEDPVGDAVRIVRSRSESLAIFIHKMSALSSYDELYALVNAY